MIDLDVYLRRIGLSGTPSLAEIHRAHVVSIPFENLDPHRGVPVSLAPEDLERKLVAERRGGYCFEHNLLLAAALEELGAQVEPMLARVRVGAAPGALRPRSHLVLRVTFEGEAWHADAGFGAGTPLEPLPFGPGGPYDQSGWQFRVLTDGDELVLQSVGADAEWRDLYGFLPEPVPLVDIETSNWFTSTHPRSPFVSGLSVTSQAGDGTRISLRGWDAPELTVETPAESTVASASREEVPGLLAGRFGLEGFRLRADGRLELARSRAASAR